MDALSVLVVTEVAAEVRISKSQPTEVLMLSISAADLTEMSPPFQMKMFC